MIQNPAYNRTCLLTERYLYAYVEAPLEARQRREARLEIENKKNTQNQIDLAVHAHTRAEAPRYYKTYLLKERQLCVVLRVAEVSRQQTQSRLEIERVMQLPFQKLSNVHLDDCVLYSPRAPREDRRSTTLPAWNNKITSVEIIFLKVYKMYYQYLLQTCMSQSRPCFNTSGYKNASAKLASM